MKPSLDTRRHLASAGLSSHDPVDVMNAFYKIEYHSPDDDKACSEYWQTMVAVLCERVVRAEKWLDEVQVELAACRAILKHEGK